MLLLEVYVLLLRGLSVFARPARLYIAHVCYLLRRYSQIDRTTKSGYGNRRNAGCGMSSEQSLITDGGLIFFRSTFASADVCIQFAEWDDRRNSKNPVPGCIESNYSSQGGGYREDRVNMIEACYTTVFPDCRWRSLYVGIRQRKLATIASRRAKRKFLLADKKNTRQNFPPSIWSSRSRRDILSVK